jgi:hypothetical protein
MRIYTAASPHASNCRVASKHSTTATTLPVGWSEIELGAPPPQLEHTSASADTQKVMALVRLHGQPLGVFALDVSMDSAWSAHSATVWTALRTRIHDHLIADGLPCRDDMKSLATAPDSVPRCIQRRSAVLNDPTQITVVVATHERPEALRVCLDGLLQQDYPRFEVVVVDNAPYSAETTNLIASRFYPRVQYVREPRHGTAWAYNRGLHAARGKIIAFVDDDVIADRCWLTGVAEGFASDSDVRCVTGPTLPTKLSAQAQLVLGRQGRGGEGFEQRIFDPAINRPGDSLFMFAAGRYSSAMNVAFDTALLRRLGGVSHAREIGKFTRGGKDLSAFSRIVLEHRVLYQPTAMVWSSASL